MNALFELLNSDLPLALAVIVAGVILLQIVPALRTYLLSHVQTQLNANLCQEVTDVIQGLMETMDEYDAVFDVAIKMIQAKYPSVNPDEFEVKIRASLSEVLMWIDPESRQKRRPQWAISPPLHAQPLVSPHTRRPRITPLTA